MKHLLDAPHYVGHVGSVGGGLHPLEVIVAPWPTRYFPEGGRAI